VAWAQRIRAAAVSGWSPNSWATRPAQPATPYPSRATAIACRIWLMLRSSLRCSADANMASACGAWLLRGYIVGLPDRLGGPGPRPGHRVSLLPGGVVVMTWVLLAAPLRFIMLSRYDQPAAHGRSADFAQVTSASAESQDLTSTGLPHRESRLTGIHGGPQPQLRQDPGRSGRPSHPLAVQGVGAKWGAIIGRYEAR